MAIYIMTTNPFITDVQVTIGVTYTLQTPIRAITFIGNHIENINI